MDEKITLNSNLAILQNKINDKVIIMVHGFSGSIKSHLHFNSNIFYPKKGYSVIRFNLYSKEKTLEKSTIKQHSKDLEKVLDYAKKNFKEIFLIGASLGGPIILKTGNTNLAKKIALWDPTLRPTYLSDRCIFDERLNLYRMNSNMMRFVSEEFYNECKNLNPLELLKNIKSTTKIFLARNGKYLEFKNDSILNSEKISHTIIEKATHYFDTEETQNDLFSQTLNFFKD